MTSHDRPLLVPITLHALTLRLKRYHAARGESLHVTRPRLESRLGRWHVIGATNTVQDWYRTLADLIDHARAAGVIAPHEDVEPESANHAAPAATPA